jgi:plastocyanin
LLLLWPFAAKLIVVRSRRLPGWALPVAGGTMVTLVVVLWYSAALWYFNNFDPPGLSPSMSAARTAYPGLSGTTDGAPSTAVIPVGGVVPITYKETFITPANVTVRAGMTIRWTNFDATLHNVAITSGPEKFSSPAFNSGGSYKVTFAKPSAYRYVCTSHAGRMIAWVLDVSDDE